MALLILRIIQVVTSRIADALPAWTSWPTRRALR
jgi:hypothetical protein